MRAGARTGSQIHAGGIVMSEQFKLGIHPPIRESGDIEDSPPGCTLEGTAGSVNIDKGVFCALRHIHVMPADALRDGMKDKCTVRVRVPGEFEMIFGDVRIRVDASFALAMHIDTETAFSQSPVFRTGSKCRKYLQYSHYTYAMQDLSFKFFNS